MRPPEDRAFYSSGASPANRRWLPHGTNTGSRSSREALLAGDVQARGWIAAPETLSGFGRAAASNTRYGCRLKLLNHSGISAPLLTPALTSRGHCTRRKVSRSRGGGREQRRRPSPTAARSAGELGVLEQGGTAAADLQPTQARRHRRAGVGTHSGDIARPPSSARKGAGTGRPLSEFVDRVAPGRRGRNPASFVPLPAAARAGRGRSIREQRIQEGGPTARPRDGAMSHNPQPSGSARREGALVQRKGHTPALCAPAARIRSSQPPPVFAVRRRSAIAIASVLPRGARNHARRDSRAPSQLLIAQCSARIGIAGACGYNLGWWRARARGRVLLRPPSARGRTRPPAPRLGPETRVCPAVLSPRALRECCQFTDDRRLNRCPVQQAEREREPNGDVCFGSVLHAVRTGMRRVAGKRARGCLLERDRLTKCRRVATPQRSMAKCNHVIHIAANTISRLRLRKRPCGMARHVAYEEAVAGHMGRNDGRRTCTSSKVDSEGARRKPCGKANNVFCNET